MTRLAWMVATLAALIALGSGVRVLGAEEPPPIVLLDPGAEGAGKLEAQGATTVTGTSAERPATLVALEGGSAWARVFVRNLRINLVPYQHLDLDLRLAAGAGQDLKVQLHDAADREATLLLDAPAEGWTTKRLDLGDFRTDPGFDPAQVTTFLLVWMKPTAQTVALGKAVLVPGSAGWRHPPQEQAKRVFGPQRARDVKQGSSDHFDVWSDDPGALKSVGALLDKEAEACAQVLQSTKAGLAGFKIPVFVFKQASDYQEYCARVLGWTKEQARRSPAAGSDNGLVFYAKAATDAQLRHRLAKAVFGHLYGVGGGVWLQDGAGEYCVRRLTDRPIAKEFAPRAKAGGHWPLEDLLRASSLHGGERNDATFDYRPIYLHAAAVVEYLLREPPPAAAGSTLAPSERIVARLKALAAIRAEGQTRLTEIATALGTSLPELEAAFLAWAPKVR